MHEKQAKFVRFGVFLFATAAVALSLSGQQSNHVRTSLVTDWSSRHLIFSMPTTREALAIASRDIRYQQQWTRRNMHPVPPTDGAEAIDPIETRMAAEAALGGITFKLGWGGLGGGPKGTKGSLKRDWASSLGPGATAGVDSYPAKFNFNTSTSSCANDFVVFGTSVAGAAAGATATATGTFSSTGPTNGQTATLTYGSGATATVTATAATDASGTGTFTGNPNSTQTATIGGTLVLKGVPGGQITVTADPAGGNTLTVGSTTYTFHATCTTAPCIVHAGVTTTDATNIADAINNTCVSATHCIVSAANTSVTASVAGSTVTLTSVASPPVNPYTLSTNDPGVSPAIGARGTGSNTGTNFIIGVTNASAATTNDATSLAATIAANGAGPGVTSTSSGATVTVTATTTGTAGNAITLAESLGNFTWSGATLSGGAALQGGANFFAITNASGTALSLNSIASNFATAVAAEATANGVPVTASSNLAVATVTSSVPGSLGNGVALAETLSNFVWSGTGTLSGGVGQANIVAYNNLYSSCGGTVPTTFWSYFTGGTMQTSPTLSLDGTQVAFVQSSGGGVASLVLLKWKSAAVTAGSPVTLTTSTASAYPACAAPCMLTLTFNGSHNDTNSSPYYDYTSDTIYVGDDNGSLHKFTPVFGGGTPAEVTTTWPVALTNSAGMVSTSPVAVSGGSVYVGTARTGGFSTTGGYFYAVNESTGAVIASSQIAGTPGIVDAPIVDPVAAMAYVAAGSDGAFGGSCGLACSAVFQFATNFAAGNGGSEAKVGTSSFGGAQMFTGDFDNIYFTSANSVSPTGSLYVCGNTGGDATIYRIPITNNSMGAPVAGPVLTSATATCSPITEADNGSTDLIFVNVEGSGNLGSCGGGGCVISFTVTGGTLPASTTPTATLPENGGASGMIIDTLGSGTGGANQVYMTPIGTGQTCPSGAGCAVQASQSALN
jgi:hypothetical protein